MEKRTLEDFAIFGGQPAVTETLHVGRPNVGERTRLLERLNRILDTKWFSNMGPFEREFEERIAGMLGVKHCIAMCNATVALEIAIRALGLSGEVITPSFTFVATAHALQWQQVVPVFCDIDPATHNIDPKRIEELITPRTTGIIGVHVWGRPCDVAALSEIAQRRNLKLLFDAAHALACSHEGQMIGGFGDAEVFSFHATKFFNTFEGGAVTTNNDDLAEKIRLMKNFGFAGYDRVVYIGTNGKMSEASAAMGLTSLESLGEFIAANRRNYEEYRKQLSGIPGLSLISFKENERHNYQYMVVEIDESQTGVTRDELVAILHEEKVIARRYFYPGCHRMEPYRSLYPDAGRNLEQTEKLAARVMTLPTGSAIDVAQIGIMGELIRTIVASGAEVHQRLAASPHDLATLARFA